MNQRNLHAEAHVAGAAYIDLLQRLYHGWLGVSDDETLLLRAAQLVAEVVNVPRVHIGLVDGEYIRWAVSTASRSADLPRYLPEHLRVDDTSVCGWTVLQRHTTYVADVRTDQRFRRVDAFFDTHTELGVPIFNDSGQVQAIIDIQSTAPIAAIDEVQPMLNLLARELGLMLDHLQRDGSLHQRNTSTQMIEHIRRALEPHLDSESIIRDLVTALPQYTPYRMVAIYRATNSNLRLQAHHGDWIPPPLLPPPSVGTSATIQVELLPAADGAPQWRVALVLIKMATPLGLIDLRTDHPPTPAEERLLNTLGSLASEALHRAQLFESLQSANKRHALLAYIVTMLRWSIDIRAIASDVIAMLGRSMEFDHGMLLLTNDENQGYIQATYTPTMTLEQHHALETALLPHLQTALKQQQIYVASTVDDPQLDPALRTVLQEQRIAALAWVPLRADERWWGFLCFHMFTPHGWEREEVRLLLEVSDQLALACRYLWLYQAEQQRRRELEALQEIIGLIGGELSLEALSQNVVHNIVAVFDVPAALIAMWRSDLSRDSMCITASSGLTSGSSDHKLDSALVAYLLEQFPPPQSISIANINSADQTHLRSLIHPDVPFCAMLGIPLIESGVFNGWLMLLDLHPRVWRESEISLTSAMAQQVIQAIQTARRYEHEHLLRTDAEQSYHDLREVLEELESTREQVLRSEKIRAIGVLANGVAHDFNNLLASILGNTQLLLTEVHSREQQYALRMIEQAAKDGAATVRRIQEYARSAETLYRDVVDLREVVRIALEFTRPSWRDAAQQRGANISIKTRCQSVYVLGSASELREVVVNLLVNAVDALPQGGTITLLTGGDQGRAFLVVADTGVGMTSELRTRIFDPFFTTKPIGEGSGMGLATAYSIIQRHGGTIRVEPNTPQGTRFILMLPEHQAQAEQPDTPPTPPIAAQRILVVDDEAAIRSVMARMLQRDGHITELAASGEEAVTMLQQHPYSMVISDLGMPGMNGLELLAHARKVHPAIVTVLLTGWGYELDHAAVQQQGIHQVIAKPFDMHEIRKTLADLIQTHATD